MAHANYYEIGLPKDMADELAELKDCDTKLFQKFLNRIDMNSLSSLTDKSILKRGDVIGLLNYPGYGYRNDGKAMWDGNRLVDLDYDEDEYGNVPSKFIVGKEFDTAFYWQHPIEQKTFMDSNLAITHNYYIYASFDKNLVSNIIKKGNFFTFDYNRDGVTEVWKFFTNNIDQYFRHKPVLSVSYYHLEQVYETDDDFKISERVDVSKYIVDLSYISILEENNYAECDFEEYDYDDETDDESDDDDVENDNDDLKPPILVRDANDKTKSSQYIINCIDEIVSQPFEYSFIDYNTLSVWTWKRVENNYTIELTMVATDSEDLTKFNNLEIATVYEHYTWRQSKTRYSYTWNNKNDSHFVLTFNNSLKFLVKKYGLISSHQVL
jgi:hypothetical protein